jgi:hypothetical protein
MRPAGLLFGIAEDEFQKRRQACSEQGLTLRPVMRTLRTPGFKHHGILSNGVDRESLTCVVTNNPTTADEFSGMDLAKDHVRVGELLGYPKCCTQFFARVWSSSCFDPVWEIGNSTPASFIENRESSYDRDGRISEVTVVLKSNPSACMLSCALRYIGVRVLSHFPCSAGCTGSIQVANDRISLARTLGISGIDATIEIMAQPYKWSCRDGIANITTADFEFDAESMDYPVRHTLVQM